MLDQKEEQKFTELRDKCRELKIMPPPEIHLPRTSSSGISLPNALVSVGIVYNIFLIK